jgi:hypothetical protein
MSCGHALRCHHPPSGRRGAPPDDRLQRMIQYAAAFMIDHDRHGVLGRPVKPGDDTFGMCDSGCGEDRRA